VSAFFDGAVVGEWALRPTRRLRPYGPDFAVQAGEFGRAAGTRRQARTVVGRGGVAPVAVPGPPGGAFWQLAPDGQTIERLYDPDNEPLSV
jgi:hypothetical protein